VSPDQAELLKKVRRTNLEFEESIRALRAREIRLVSGSQDISEDHVAILTTAIARNEQLLRSIDPDGLTALEPHEKNR
jgi:hypothetical protein